MNQQSDIERVLSAWFDEGPTVMPDRVTVTVADRIGRTRQQRTWRLPWRLPDMNPLLKVGAAAVAVVLVLTIGYNLLPRQSGGIGGTAPTASPTATPTANPTPSIAGSPSDAGFDCRDGTTCAGDLVPGPMRSNAFSPSFTFTATSGFANSLDKSNVYQLDTGSPDYVMLWSDVAISQHTATCEAVKQPGVGNAVRDWINYATHHPGMIATGVAPVSLGTAQGQVVDLNVKPGWTKGCPNFDFKAVEFIMNAHGPSGVYGAAEGLNLRLYVLDVRGQTVLILHYGDHPASEELIRSIRFSPGS